MSCAEASKKAPYLGTHLYTYLCSQNVMREQEIRQVQGLHSPPQHIDLPRQVHGYRRADEVRGGVVVVKRCV
jgi:hypothetical protein